MKMGLLGFNSEPEFQKLSDMVAGCQNSEAARRQGGFCMPGWNLAKEYAEFTTDYLYASLRNISWADAYDVARSVMKCLR